MKLPVNAIKSIAVFRALQLGDMLCYIPFLRSLRHAFPAARITLIGLPWAVSLLKRFPNYLDDFMVFPGYPGLPEQKTDPRAFTQFLRDVQNRNFDLLFQSQGNGTIVNQLLELFDAGFFAGFCTSGDHCPNEKLFLDYPEQVHEVERHLSLLQYLGIQTLGSELEFPIYSTDREEYHTLNLDLQQGKYVCIHPGSRSAARQWPPHFFAALANQVASKGFKVVLTGTAEEKNIIDEVCRHLHHEPVVVAGKTSLGATAVLINHAFLLISNCTGVSHIAAGLRTPSLIISMDGEPHRWAPLNRQLHHTVDWTRNPGFNTVLNTLNERFLFNDNSVVDRRHVTSGDNGPGTG